MGLWVVGGGLFRLVLQPFVAKGRRRSPGGCHWQRLLHLLRSISLSLPLSVSLSDHMANFVTDFGVKFRNEFCKAAGAGAGAGAGGAQLTAFCNFCNVAESAAWA